MPTLRPDQAQGVAWIKAKHFALLADEPGVGKTPIVAVAIKELKLRRGIIACPSVARVNWLRELDRWGVTGARVLEKLSEPFDINGFNIVSYDYARVNHADLCFAGPWDLVVLDEGHFAKDPSSQRTKALYGRKALQGLVHYTRRLWSLTGTPLPNHPGEVWPLLFASGVTKLAYTTFVSYFCEGYPMGHEFRVTGANEKRLPELQALLRDSGLMLRRLKEDVMKDLPPISFEEVVVPASPVDLETCAPLIRWIVQKKHAEMHAQIQKEYGMLGQILGAGLKEDDLLAALKAAASSIATVAMLNGIEKVPAVVEIIRAELEANAYRKIVLFAKHQPVIDGLRQGLNKFNAVTLYGGTPPDKRQRNIDKFQKDYHCRVFIGNITAAGTAITLTAAHQVGMVEMDYVPGNNAQAVMRCHRHGQDKPVTVRTFALANSLDQRIMSILKRKTRQITRILDADREGFIKENDPFS